MGSEMVLPYEALASASVAETAKVKVPDLEKDEASAAESVSETAVSESGLEPA
jgi:hypothetical protein